MANKEIKVAMKQRSDTAANWKKNNPILLEGEFGYETDTKSFKIGNGVSTWNDLAYNPGVKYTNRNNKYENKDIPFGGEIFNDYDNNIASNFSHAEGQNTKAYIYGYSISISSIDSDGHAIINISTGPDHPATEIRSIINKPLILYDRYGGISPSGFKITGITVPEDESCTTYKTNIPSEFIQNVFQPAYISTYDMTGIYAIPIDSISHAEGEGTIAGYISHAEGKGTKASDISHAEGEGTIAGYISHAEGKGTKASHISHAEGYHTIASGEHSHAEGIITTASGYYSHAEGDHTKAIGDRSHAEGGSTTAIGDRSHAEGGSTTASGDRSHAEGGSTTASGKVSHAEGGNTTASGMGSHAEGIRSYASGDYSHAEGGITTASGMASHAEGEGTKASSKYQHVQGKYNIEDNANKYAHIVGNGTSDTNRSNAHTLDWNGNAWYQGNITVGGTYNSETKTVDGAKELVTEEVIERIKYYGDPNIIPSDESYFTVNDTGETITGLTDTGKTQTELVIPYEINGKKITTLFSGKDGSDSPPVSILDGNNVITKVVIPKSVTTLGEYAFLHCTSLTSINIPNSVRSIESSAFEYCTSLTSINIPNSVRSIEGGTFGFCGSLTSINIPNSVTSIESGAFNYCTSLTSIEIPNSVTSIGEYAFNYCTNLTIYCEQGSYAETFAKGNYIPVVYTDIKAITLVGQKTAEGGEIFNAYTNNQATGEYSHAEGDGTIASGTAQHVQGKYNIEDNANKYAHIVGNGTSDTDRSNAHTLDWNGNAWFAGDITSGDGSKLSSIKSLEMYDDATVVPDPASYYTYTTTNGEVTITGLTDTGKEQPKLVIPYEIDGNPVTELGAGNAGNSIILADSKTTELYIPSTVTNILDYAFCKLPKTFIRVKFSNNAKLIIQRHCFIFKNKTIVELPSGTICNPSSFSNAIIYTNDSIWNDTSILEYANDNLWVVNYNSNIAEEYRNYSGSTQAKISYNDIPSNVIDSAVPVKTATLTNSEYISSDNKVKVTDCLKDIPIKSLYISKRKDPHMNILPVGTAMTGSGISNGISYTFYNNGMVYVNGTATSTVKLTYLCTGLESMRDTEGKLWGCPAGGSTSTYYLEVYDNMESKTLATDTGSGCSFSYQLPQDINIVIKSGTTCNNLLFMPCLFSDTSFVPELTPSSYIPYMNGAVENLIDFSNIKATGSNNAVTTTDEISVNSVSSLDKSFIHVHYNKHNVYTIKLLEITDMTKNYIISGIPKTKGTICSIGLTKYTSGSSIPADGTTITTDNFKLIPDSSASKYVISITISYMGSTSITDEIIEPRIYIDKDAMTSNIICETPTSFDSTEFAYNGYRYQMKIDNKNIAIYSKYAIDSINICDYMTITPQYSDGISLEYKDTNPQYEFASMKYVVDTSKLISNLSDRIAKLESLNYVLYDDTTSSTGN